MSRDTKYDVALSFAGEDRGYVNRVASSLRDAGIKVFYDDYEKVELWGRDLYDHLDYVYRKASRYCIIFVSKAYADKVWTNHERKSAQARALEENAEYVLPARFDDTELPGLRPTVGYVDLTDITPEALSKLIIEKLGPQPVTPGFPMKVDRLYKALGLKATKSKDKDRRKEVRDVALSFYEAFERMSLQERRAVAGVMAFGCIGNLPDGIHISLDYLSRMTGMPKAEIMNSLSAVRSLNVKVRVRDMSQVHQAQHGELLPDDKDLLVTFWSPRAPDVKDSSHIAYQTIQQAANHFCADHGLEVVTALDFRLLSSDEQPARTIPVTEHDTPHDHGAASA